MHLIIASGTTTYSDRDIAPSGGTPGWATDGNPVAAKPRTRFPAAHYNSMVEEIITVIQAAGISLNAADNTLLRQALDARYLRSAGIGNSLTDFGSLSGGVCVLPGGLIIQNFATPLVNPPGGGSSVSYSFTFPTAFPNFCSGIFGSDGGFAGFVWGAFSGLSATGGTGYVWSQTSGTGARGHLMAFGR